MFTKMELPAGSSKGNHVYFAHIPANAASPYRIDCGFKARKIASADSYSASSGRIYAWNLFYDADTDEEKYKHFDSSGALEYAIGSGNSPGLAEIGDDYVIINSPSANVIADIIITD